MVKLISKLFSEDDLSFTYSQTSSQGGTSAAPSSSQKNKRRRRCKSASDEPMRGNSKAHAQQVPQQSVLSNTLMCISEFAPKTAGAEACFKTITSIASDIKALSENSSIVSESGKAALVSVYEELNLTALKINCVL